MYTRAVADRARIYGEAYEARQRDPVVDYSNRASVANGKMSKWQRFQMGELQWIDTPEGMRAVTPTQNRVWAYLSDLMTGDGGQKRMLTMREMAAELSVSASTVSRAITKFVSWGLLTAIVSRGRFGGVVLLRYVRDGGFLDSFRKAAKDRVRRWKEAADRRLSRLALNVAPYLNEEGVRVLSSTSTSTTTKGATLTVQRKWTPDELCSLGII